MTNITELAYCLPASSAPERVTKVTGVPSLLPGETYDQAAQRRAENAKRIEAKLAAKIASRINK